jgi:hypothetical protein
MSPSTQSAIVGDTVTIDIDAEDVTALAGYDFIIQFNPAVLEFVGQTDGGFTGSTGRQMSCPSPIIDNSLGFVQFGCGSYNTTPEGPSGDGRLATARFKAKATGTSDLLFLKAELANFNGDDCCGFPFVEDSAVAVGEDSEPALPEQPAPDPERRTSRNAQGDLPAYELLPDGTTNAGASGGSNTTPGGTGGGGNTAGSSSGATGVVGGSGGTETAAGGVAGSSSAGASSSAGGVPVAGHGPQPGDDHTPLFQGASLLAFAGMILIALAYGVRRESRRTNNH